MKLGQVGELVSEWETYMQKQVKQAGIELGLNQAETVSLELAN